ncbi:MAG: hypothetical protein Q8P86_03060 [bacterium]|nr:hypothetical protein [bacterium]
MVQVQFNQPELLPARVLPVRRGLTGWLVEKKIVSSEKKAVEVSVLVSVIFLVLGIYLMARGGAFSFLEPTAPQYEVPIDNNLNPYDLSP